MLGLLGILRIGRTLTPPLSVNGAWRLDADAARFAALRCSNSAFTPLLTTPPLYIFQSGKNLRISLNALSKIPAAGSINGKSVKAFIAEENVDPTCGPVRTLTLAATLDPLADPRTLNGKLYVEGCDSCQPVDFRAVRQPRTYSEGAH